MKKILIVIDMQNDFINGALGTKEAQAIVPNVIEKINSYDPSRVIFTRDTHYGNYMYTQEGKNLPVPHCISGTYGWEINSDLKATDAYKFTNEQGIANRLDKRSFGYTSWYDFFKQRHMSATEIELIGVCTDICVVSNALILKALFSELPITVDASCCAGVTPESHQAALTTMKMCQINVIGE